MPELLILKDDELLSRIPLQPSTRIGRGSDNEIRIPDKKVSRSQCAIEFLDGEWYVADRSGRGTRVGHRTVSEHGALLKEGDELRLGDYVGVFDAAHSALTSTAPEITLVDARTGRTKLKLQPRGIRRASLRFRTEEGERVVALRNEEGFRVLVGTQPRNAGVLIELSDPSVSGEHLEVVYRSGRWEVRDRESTNGTWVDGVRVLEAVLDRRCALQAGETTLTFEPELSGEEGATNEALPGLITRDPEMARIATYVRRVALEKAPVTIHGESGTGKEVIARALHLLSPRASGPFVALNCGALPRETLESELFGHERGAYTGADRARAGAFEEADKGTLFLDEIGDLPLDAQVKLLRTLERGEVRRMGASRIQTVDVRVVSASHKNLNEMVSEGTFREDLFYRLCVVPIELPPLRLRVKDIMPLAEHFSRQFSPGGDVGFSDGARARLEAHAWPGNAREVRNVVQLAMVQRRGPVITEEDIVLQSPIRRTPRDVLCLTGLTIDQIEREAYRMALERHGQDKKAAMEELGVARSTFFRKIEDFGLVVKKS